ncbi:MAG: hypothetical protein DKT66_20610 [Candidatus Melainabacteria bacterium]|nr:MAG: hypothetical protein DKT66_20610 [Candidatus Melainabacteria bacterium]
MPKNEVENAPVTKKQTEATTTEIDLVEQVGEKTGLSKDNGTSSIHSETRGSNDADAWRNSSINMGDDLKNLSSLENNYIGFSHTFTKTLNAALEKQGYKATLIDSVKPNNPRMVVDRLLSIQDTTDKHEHKDFAIETSYPMEEDMRRGYDRELLEGGYDRDLRGKT